MNASVRHRWINAEEIILGRLYNQPVGVLSRPASKPVRSCSKKMTAAAGIPIPQRNAAQAAA